MKLDKHKKCDKCGTVYSTDSFANMYGDGTTAYSEVEIYGDIYHLCPTCTSAVYKLLQEH